MDSSVKILNKCLKIIEKSQPSLSYQLKLCDPKDLEFCRTINHELNLKRYDHDQETFYHSPISAIKEAQEWFSSLNLKNMNAIFIYGVGLGYYYEAAKNWLKEKSCRRLVFIEEDLEVLFRLCETELGYQLLKDPQVSIRFLQNPAFNHPLANAISWEFFNASYLISSLNFYQKVKIKRFSDLKNDIHLMFARKRVVVDEYLNLGLPFFRNFYPNLLKLPEAYSGNALFNVFKGIPAIICGAGPSLNQNIHLLSEIRERALLFAGGSALNALIPSGIIPHFGVAIDPNIHQLSRVGVTELHHIPFFYRQRLNTQALQAIKGPLLYLNGEGGYSVCDWFEKELKIEGEKLEGGYNVVNFSLQIARALGCNPIIIVGTDLAFTNQDYYAEESVKNLKLSQEELKVQVPDDERVLRTDIYGKPTQTLWKWISEAKWICDFANTYPEVTLINATEGGLGFEGVPNLSLKEAALLFSHSDQINLSTIAEEIKKTAFKSISKERILELLNVMKNSLEKTAILLSKMSGEIDLWISQIKEGSLAPLNSRPINLVILEGDLEREVAYLYILEIFDQLFHHLHQRDIQELDLSKRGLSTKHQLIQKLGIEKKRAIFLSDVAQSNQALIRSVIPSES
ncbi:MAG: motility associated factor glycosyltransferase family protein [Parachlamydiaceae bacterium]